MHQSEIRRHFIPAARTTQEPCTAKYSSTSVVFMPSLLFFILPLFAFMNYCIRLNVLTSNLKATFLRYLPFSPIASQRSSFLLFWLLLLVSNELVDAYKNVFIICYCQREA